MLASGVISVIILSEGIIIWSFMASAGAIMFGIMPASFRVFAAADVYIPVWPWLSGQPQDRTWHPGLLGIARLKMVWCSR